MLSMLLALENRCTFKCFMQNSTSKIGFFKKCLVYFHWCRLFAHKYSPLRCIQTVHCKKMLAGMSLTKLSLVGKIQIIPDQGEFSQ
jgi:hypothetical protein